MCTGRSSFDARERLVRRLDRLCIHWHGGLKRPMVETSLDWVAMLLQRAPNFAVEVATRCALLAPAACEALARCCADLPVDIRELVRGTLQKTLLRTDAGVVACREMLKTIPDTTGYRGAIRVKLMSMEVRAFSLSFSCILGGRCLGASLCGCTVRCGAPERAEAIRRRAGCKTSTFVYHSHRVAGHRVRDMAPKGKRTMIKRIVLLKLKDLIGADGSIECAR